jgi:hypothetical protein
MPNLLSQSLEAMMAIGTAIIQFAVAAIATTRRPRRQRRRPQAINHELVLNSQL